MCVRGHNLVCSPWLQKKKSIRVKKKLNKKNVFKLVDLEAGYHWYFFNSITNPEKRIHKFKNEPNEPSASAVAINQNDLNHMDCNNFHGKTPWFYLAQSIFPWKMS